MMVEVFRPLLAYSIAIALCELSSAQIETRAAVFPGVRSTWHGFDRYDFKVDGKPVIVVAPSEPAAGHPWIWHAEFFGSVPKPEIALLAKGFHIVHIQVPDLFGSPTAVAHWDALYKELTEKYQLAKRVALVGISRGGLYCYNWAAKNPEKVACIYGDAPVCDLRSWPAGKGKGTGNQAEMSRLMEVYGAASEEQLFERALSPIDKLQPLVDARIPLLHVYGDADQEVPADENTGVLAERYKKLGGEIILIAKPGVGHVHGLDDSTPIVEFIESHCRREASATDSELRKNGPHRRVCLDRYLTDPIHVALLAGRFERRQVFSGDEAAKIYVAPDSFKSASDAEFTTSWDQTLYDCTFRDRLLKTDIGRQNWASRTNYPALNLIQNLPIEMMLVVHRSIAQSTAHLRRHILRPDGFASLPADAAGNNAVTNVLSFRRRDFASTSPCRPGANHRLSSRTLTKSPVPVFRTSVARNRLTVRSNTM